MDDAFEQKLVERARRGDRTAFQQIVESHKEQVFQLALGMTRNHHDAEDMVQEVFLKAYKSLQRFRGQAKLSSWLYRITLNTCHDARRRRRPEEAGNLAEVGDAATLRLAEESPRADPHRRSESQQIGLRVRSALGQLTAAERSVFVLRHYNQLSTREAAEALDRAEGTVKNLLFRALRKLRDELGELQSPRAAS